jgi:hypothetical protein
VKNINSLFPILDAKVPSANNQTFERLCCAACLSSKRLNNVSSENLPAPKISTINEATKKVYGAAA